MQRAARMKKEMQIFLSSPPHGISCWAKGDSIEELEAQIIGSEGTPYEGGIFKLEIQIPERYPFEPPKVRFVTPIYHPNIDNAGRICLDSLKMPPKGAWKPALNISTLLTSIQLLMNEPNPDDPLMTDISSEFKYEKTVFMEKAKEWTKKYATSESSGDKENLGQADMLPKGATAKTSELPKGTTDETSNRKRTAPLDEIHSAKQQKS